jgi:drug/metabolite transporter (DMT)-like permease
MYPYIFSFLLLKSSTPYFRKHILNTLNSVDFIFINTLLIFFVVSLLFFYFFLFDKPILRETFKNCKKLSPTQYGCLFLLAVLTISSSYVMNHFDKYYNTPLINSIFKKVISVFFLFVVGVFLFEENYNFKQILGILLCSAGLYLIFQ